MVIRICVLKNPIQNAEKVSELDTNAQQPNLEQQSTLVVKTGNMITFKQFFKEKKDGCYYKAKRKFKVFPSAYASGYIARCRKRGGKIK
ncbi:hypothetical protein EBR43_12510 [bacterium]|nr:hypothetical protein [bacterium]